MGHLDWIKGVEFFSSTEVRVENILCSWKGKLIYFVDCQNQITIIRMEGNSLTTRLVHDSSYLNIFFGF